MATATAIALVVDTARLPVYLATQWKGIAALWPVVLVLVLGVLLGTIVGTRFLDKIPERLFRRVVAVFLLGLGIFMLASL